VDGTQKSGTVGRLSPGVRQAALLLETIQQRADRCDAACPAEAQVHLVRYPHCELAFCHHHYRQHALALMAAGWQQRD
jgi:hypothetical protein